MTGHLIDFDNITINDLKKIPVKYYRWIISATISATIAIFLLGWNCNTWFKEFVVTQKNNPQAQELSHATNDKPAGNKIKLSDIQSLRKKNGVSLIDTTENELPLEKIQPGHYAFVYGITIHHFINNGLPLELHRDEDSNKFEIHQLANKKVYIVLYITKENVSRLTRTNTLDILAFNKPYNDAVIYLLELDSVDEFNSRTIHDNNNSLQAVDIKLNRTGDALIEQ